MPTTEPLFSDTSESDEDSGASLVYTKSGRPTASLEAAAAEGGFTTITVDDFTVRVTDALLSAGVFRRRVRVTGELMNVRGRFFQLKSDTTNRSVPCVMWARRDASRARPLQNGDLVIIDAVVNMYDARTQLQFVVSRVELRDADIIGTRMREHASLKARLASDGTLNFVRKPVCPGKIRKVAVVTSERGAALQDFLRIAKERAPDLDVVVYDTRVQGDVGEMIARAVRRANVEANADAIVVTRGGGSETDLWCFNDERVVRAIAACDTLIVTAIGHARDSTLADQVSDLTVATPTEAAMRVTSTLAENRAIEAEATAVAEREKAATAAATAAAILIQAKRAAAEAEKVETNTRTATEEALERATAKEAAAQTFLDRARAEEAARLNAGETTRWRLYDEGGLEISADVLLEPSMVIEGRRGTARAMFRVLTSSST